jgi:peptidoglycan/xylan/chitin deacetylase (PgdA/CDA1 family)
MKEQRGHEHEPGGSRVVSAGRPTPVTTSPNLAEFDARSLLSLQSSIGNQAVAALVLGHAKLPVQRVEVDAGVKADAGHVDAGAATASGGLTRSGGDKASKKIVYVSWTFDDGPTKLVTEAMAKVSPKAAAAPVPGTWFIMRSQIKSEADLKTLKDKQDGGQEFGIHSMDETRSHVGWFPHSEKESYPDIQKAMADLQEFHGQLRKAGLVIHFVRAPGGLISEIHNYLASLKVASDILKNDERAARLDAIARAIITGQPVPPERTAAARAGTTSGRDAGMAAAAAGTPTLGGVGVVAAVDAGVQAAESAAIAKVTADVGVMKQTLTTLGLHEWGGNVQEDPGVQGWEVESEPKEVSDPKEVKRLYGSKFKALANDAVLRFEKLVDETAKDGGPHSLVILAHDTKIPETKIPVEDATQGFKRPQHVAQDMLTMEAYALEHGVQIQYCTMSELYEKRVKAKP